MKNMHKKTIDGKFFKIDLKIKKFIKARYHKIKDWKMDPKGYFLIKIDKKKKLLNVGYCKSDKRIFKQNDLLLSMEKQLLKLLIH